MSEPTKNSVPFTIIPDDKEFVTKIAGLIPLEQIDRERLEVLIAGHRVLHTSASPRMETERQLALELRKSQNIHRIVWALIKRLGGTVAVSDDDIPFDWKLELEPTGSKTLTIVANRCPAPDAPAVPKG